MPLLQPETTKLEIPPIISVDDHVMEPPDLWERYLPAKYRDVGPRVVRLPWERDPDLPTSVGPRQPLRPASSGPEADCWVVEDIHQFINRSLASVGLDATEIYRAPMNYSEMRSGCYEVKSRLADMDIIAVERSLSFPNMARFAGQLFLWLKDSDLALACIKAYNDWMVEEWAGESGGRLIPLCLIPLWDPVAAGEEVRRNAERGVRAVSFSELPSRLGLPSIHDKDDHWVPFIEACEETSTVICIHIGSSSTSQNSSDDAPHAVGLATITLNAQLCLADWLFSGLLPRYPSLRLAFSESQIGWMPYMFERVDSIWRKGNKFSEIHPSITKPPSQYIADRVFGCFFEDDFGLASREAIGIDQITFETDYPHQDSTWPDTQKYLNKAMQHLPKEDVFKIVRGNAIRMLGLPETLVS
jgi:predicted TIM-barrel fold metal-dependent hydrolase